MSEKWKVGIIGCGGRGREHAAGYAACENVEIVALADPFPEGAQKLAAEHGIAKENIFEDHRAMLGKHRLDIVSVCTWPAQHAPQVLDAIASGARAIMCEKPMAPTFGEARSMHDAAQKSGVQLSFCHQRRFTPQFRTARQLIENGAIGTVKRLEGFCPNLFDWGTHWFDMMFFLNRETPAVCVLGQIDIAGARTVFGAWVESSGLSWVQFENGVSGVMMTGKDQWNDCAVRAVGSEGVLEIVKPDGGDLRLLRAGKEWQTPELGDFSVENATIQSVQNVVQCLRDGSEPELSSRKALATTELIFATYQSARMRAKISLPLQIDDSPLEDLIAQRDSNAQNMR